MNLWRKKTLESPGLKESFRSGTARARLEPGGDWWACFVLRRDGDGFGDIIEEMCDARKVRNVQYGIQGGLSMNVCYPTSEVVRKYAERPRVAYLKERKKEVGK